MRLSPISIDLLSFLTANVHHSPRPVAGEIVSKVQVLTRHPRLGRPIAGREEYRQIVLQVLRAAYVFQYRLDGERIVMLRVFHAREARE